MKKSLFSLFLLLLTCFSSAQQVNGVMVMSDPNLHVIKVWGTGQERAYAQGYLLGEIAAQLFIGHLKPALGDQYQTARDIIINGNDLAFDSVYIQEAITFQEGYIASTPNPLPTDYVDILIGNAWMDIIYLIGDQSPYNCSSLMSWGDATAGTNLDGRSVITSHLDSYPTSYLLASHAIVANFPSEPNTQPWLSAYLSGCLAPSYGCNRYFGIFCQDMGDYTEPVHHDRGYLPYKYALRKALESYDYNEDQEHNVMDVKAALDDCSQGFAAAVIVSVLSETRSNDSLTAMVCEIASNSPTHTYRFNTYPDSIPGDNLYTANCQIARNNAMHFCNRYNNMRNHMSDGTLIGVEENWNLMKNYSLQSTNIQVKQYAPEADLLKMAVMTSINVPAALNEPFVFSLTDLLGGVPSANAGDNAVICENESYSLSGEGLACSFLWTTTGDGTFSDSSILNPVYTPGQGDIASRGADLILTGYLNSEKFSADTMSLTIIILPEIPSMPTGPETVDLNYTATSEYTITGSSPFAVYVWELLPEEAGIISGTTASSLVEWNTTFYGTAFIRVKEVNSCGEGEYSEALEVLVYNSVGGVQSAVGGRRSAVSCWPNPFSAYTVIEYELPVAGIVKLGVYDCLGREMMVLADQYQQAGVHQVRWSAEGLPAGMYFVYLTENGKLKTANCKVMRH